MARPTPVWLHTALAGMIVVLIVAVPPAPCPHAADCAVPVIDTFAGGGVGDGSKAIRANAWAGHGIILAPDGSIYFPSWDEHRIRKIDPAGTVSTVVGDGWHGARGRGRFAGDGGPALEASLNRPVDVALAPDGSLYIADAHNFRVRKVGPDGIITTVAGDGWSEEYSYSELESDMTDLRGRFTGDGGPATEASLNGVGSVALGRDGSIYIGGAGRVRKVDPAGMITTVAGNGQRRFSGDGGPATQASFESVGDIDIGPDGALYIADTTVGRVRKVDATGIITTVAGDGWHERGHGRFSGDGGPATKATLDYPHAIVAASDGSVYIADTFNCRIRRVDRQGIITTIAGSNGRNDGSSIRFAGDGSPAARASLDCPYGVALAGDGSLYIADSDNHRIRKVQAVNGRVDGNSIITTVAGNGDGFVAGDGGPATSAMIGADNVAVAADGTLYLSCAHIAKVDRRGVITTIAGNGKRGYAGDGGPARRAQFGDYCGVAVGPDGSIYVADACNYRIRKISRAGVITTVVGDGYRGHGGGRFAGDGGLAIKASLGYPSDVTVGPDGSLYIADHWNNRVRKVDPVGIITTLAGNGEQGYAGDGGPAGQARLNLPKGVALGPDGSLYIADYQNQRVRMVQAVNGTLTPSCQITTVAGTGKAGCSGDGGPAIEASLHDPVAVAVDRDGRVYISDEANRRVRMVGRDGIITTFAGNGEQAFMSEGDGGPATEARLSSPRGIAISPDGTLYVADRGTGRVRRVRCVPGKSD